MYKLPKACREKEAARAPPGTTHPKGVQQPQNQIRMGIWSFSASKLGGSQHLGIDFSRSQQQWKVQAGCETHGTEHFNDSVQISAVSVRGAWWEKK